MATTVANLTQRVRRYMGDWPDLENLSASLSSSATSITVSDGTQYFVNEPLEIESEAMMVRGIAANVLTVERGAMGTTAVTHVSNSSVLRKPHFLQIEVVDALADAVDHAFPFIYKRFVDETVTVVDNQFEYTIPSDDNGNPFFAVYRVDLKDPGLPAFYETRRWRIIRGSTPKIRFKTQPVPASTVRISAASQFPRLTYAGSLDTQWPVNLENPLVECAASMLLASGEARRVREDTGVIDMREQANTVGASMNAANAVLNRFFQRIANSGFPPLPRHAVRI